MSFFGLFNDVLIAAFGSVFSPFGIEVVSYEEYLREKDNTGNYFLPLGVDHIFNVSYSLGEHGWPGIVACRVADIDGVSPYYLAVKWGKRPEGHRPSEAPPDDEISVRIKTIHEKERILRVKKLDTVRRLKERLQDKFGVRYEEQRLTHEGKVLDDDYASIEEYGIGEGSNVCLIRLGENGAIPIGFVDESHFDHEYDFDFTNVNDGSNTFYRGGKQYVRPCGWYRYALKVKAKYENDTWLGEPGYRRQSSEGEWPVSYHGTKQKYCQGIAEEGFLLKKGERKMFGRGIYSAPCIDTAAYHNFATPFEHEGKKYQVVFQNRISTEEHFKEIAAEETPLKKEYWIQEDENLIRPYGICIRECPRDCIIL